MDYKNYEVEDFLADESFQDWVLKRSNQGFWETWIDSHPDKKNACDEAAKLIHLFKNKEKKEEVSAERINASWKNFEASLHRGGHSRYMAYYKYAAVITIFILALSSFFIWRSSLLDTESYTYYSSPYGERTEVILPDGSNVMLNANSIIKISTQWGNQKEREVWMEQGEAFFSVVKSKSSSFIVHTQHLHVSVLGTQFNVNLRRGKTAVVLKEGKVKLNTQDDQESEMVPGEFVEYIPGQTLLLKKVNPADYYSWLEGKIIFNDTPVSEIAQFIEDHYGKKVWVEDKDLMRRTLTGELPNDHLELLLHALSSVMNIKTTQTDEAIVLEKN